MKNINWDDILNMKIKAPFILMIILKKNYCEGNDKIGDETMERYRDYINDDFFIDYFYCRFDFGKFICLKLDIKKYGSFNMKSFKNENKMRRIMLRRKKFY
jgi:hypothetical protein